MLHSYIHVIERVGEIERRFSPSHSRPERRDRRQRLSKLTTFPRLMLTQSRASR